MGISGMGHQNARLWSGGRRGSRAVVGEECKLAFPRRMQSANCRALAGSGRS